MAQHCLHEQMFALLLWLLICSSKQRLLLSSSVGEMCTPFTSNVMSGTCACKVWKYSNKLLKLKELQSMHSSLLGVPCQNYLCYGSHTL